MPSPTPLTGPIDGALGSCSEAQGARETSSGGYFALGIHRTYPAPGTGGPRPVTGAIPGRQGRRGNPGTLCFVSPFAIPGPFSEAVAEAHGALWSGVDRDRPHARCGVTALVPAIAPNHRPDGALSKCARACRNVGHAAWPLHDRAAHLTCVSVHLAVQPT